MAKEKAAGQVYQLKIALSGIKPPIWRRVQVKDCTLLKLHQIIQTAMDWEGYHLHEFEVGSERYGDPEQWVNAVLGDDLDFEDERKIKLSRLVAQGIKKFQYLYDMGDNWLHLIQIEKVLVAEPGLRYPRCIAGKRACPPEDCGGPWGYAELVEAIEDPDHPRHKELLSWAGGEFDPEAFDIKTANRCWAVK